MLRAILRLNSLISLAICSKFLGKSALVIQILGSISQLCKPSFVGCLIQFLSRAWLVYLAQIVVSFGILEGDLFAETLL